MELNLKNLAPLLRCARFITSKRKKYYFIKFLSPLLLKKYFFLFLSFLSLSSASLLSSSFLLIFFSLSCLLSASPSPIFIILDLHRRQSSSSIFIVVAQLPSHAADPSRLHRTQERHGPIEALCLVKAAVKRCHDRRRREFWVHGFWIAGVVGFWVFDFFFFLFGLVVIVDCG